MQTMNELKSIPAEELKQQLDQIAKEVFEMRNELRISKKIEKPHELKNKKKERARILTALNQNKERNK